MRPQPIENWLQVVYWFPENGRLAAGGETLYFRRGRKRVAVDIAYCEGYWVIRTRRLRGSISA